MKDAIIDHINQVIRQSAPERYGNMGRGRYRVARSGIPQLRYHVPAPLKAAGETDELTPWISTTANLDWALWYIAKLLTQPRQGPRHGAGPGFKHESVKLAVISISTDRRVNKELYVAPFLWSRPERRDRLSDVDRERYNRARKAAISAKEVLFYGKIFKESILADLTFTREVGPVFLFSPISLSTRGAHER